MTFSHSAPLAFFSPCAGRVWQQPTEYRDAPLNFKLADTRSVTADLHLPGGERRHRARKWISFHSIDSSRAAFKPWRRAVASSIITVATMKGGSGKSTLASCLAVHWQQAG